MSNPSSPALLSLGGIGKTYVEPVLSDVSLEIRPGQILALTGENGAGKSTLSKIVCGLVQSTTYCHNSKARPVACSAWAAVLSRWWWSITPSPRMRWKKS